MINVIYSNDPNVAFNTLLFPNQNSANQTYIQDQLSSFSNTISDVGRNWLSGVTDLYESINSSHAAQVARSAIRSATGMFNNRIVELSNIHDFQMAKPIMQRWVMANPVVRERFQQQTCVGYVDSYVDLEPGRIGENHYDYRQVMSGVVQIDDEGEFVKIYSQDIKEGDEELQHSDKVTILRAWDLAEMFMKAAHQDPTCPLGGSL